MIKIKKITIKRMRAKLDKKLNEIKYWGRKLKKRLRKGLKSSNKKNENKIE
jgi:hypothetical protein